jgi:CRP-like cAMP-binding protein
MARQRSAVQLSQESPPALARQRSQESRPSLTYQRSQESVATSPPLTKQRSRKGLSICERKTADTLISDHAVIRDMLEEIKAEQNRMKESPAAQHAAASWVVLPRSRLRKRWDFVLVWLVLFSVVLAPLQLGFHSVFERLGWQVAQGVADIAFVLDLVLNFVTAFYDSEANLIADHRAIALHYLRSWFATDLVPAFPIDWIMALAGSRPNVGRINQAIRVVRMIKVLRMLKLKEGRLSIDVKHAHLVPSRSLGWYIAGLAYLWHVVACGFWALAWPPGADAWGASADLDGAPFIEQYLHALYWGVGTTGSLLYPTPATPGQTIYSLFVVVVGLFVNGAIIGSIASLVSSLNARKQEERHRLDAVRRYLMYKKVPPSLRFSVLSYYRFLFSSMQSLDEQRVLRDLPPMLQLQVDLVLARRLFTRIALFKFFSPEAILLLVQRLQPVLVLPGEIILKQGQGSTGLFFIVRGLVEVLRDGELVALMAVNEFFGERSLLTDSPCGATVRAKDFSDLCLLEKTDVNFILAEFPAIVEQILHFAEKRDRNDAARLFSPAVRGATAVDAPSRHDEAQFFRRLGKLSASIAQMSPNSRRLSRGMSARMSRVSRGTRLSRRSRSKIAALNDADDDESVRSESERDVAGSEAGEAGDSPDPRANIRRGTDDLDAAPHRERSLSSYARVLAGMKEAALCAGLARRFSDQSAGGWAADAESSSDLGQSRAAPSSPFWGSSSAKVAPVAPQEAPSEASPNGGAPAAHAAAGRHQRESADLLLEHVHAASMRRAPPELPTILSRGPTRDSDGLQERDSRERDSRHEGSERVDSPPK